MLRVVKSRAASKRAAVPKKTKPSRRACECVLLARGGSRARSSHATTHPNNHQLHIVLNELRTDEHGKVIEPYYKSFAVRSEPFPYTSTVTVDLR